MAGNVGKIKTTPSVTSQSFSGGNDWKCRTGRTLWADMFVVVTKLRHTASSGVWVWYDFAYNAGTGILSITYRRETDSAGYFGNVTVYYVD